MAIARPDPAALQANLALGDSQTKTEAAVTRARAVQAGKRSKNLLQLGLLNARALISQAQQPVGAFALRTHLHQAVIR